MGDDNNTANSAIPKWQRVPQEGLLPRPPPDDQSREKDRKDDTDQNEIAGDEHASSPSETASPAPVDDSKVNASDEELRETIETFLQDPVVRNASREEKRAFFQKKGIPEHIIAMVLQPADADLSPSDFGRFQKQNSPPQPQPSISRAASGPPIIMYPEDLVKAHRPPPLVTMSRIVNTAYIAGGIAALFYGVSKFLVAPMTDSLADTRRDFATHSRSKVDELNERLEGIVSEIPDIAKKKGERGRNGDAAALDTMSETSDPTELFHRDIGTQTSPPRSRPSSPSFAPQTAEPFQPPASRQSDALDTLSSCVSGLLDTLHQLELGDKEVQDSMERLRQYLDSTVYVHPSIRSSGFDLIGDFKRKQENEGGEALKKEIRALKAVFLSAKRFPGPISSRAAAR